MTGRLIHGVDVGSAPFDLDDAAADWVETTLAGLSSDEQVGQLFTLLSHDGDAATLAALVQHARPGGLMFRPLPAADVLAGTAALRRESRIPVLVAANLERGGDGIAREGTCVGSPMQVAATGAPEAADWLGTVCGREARAVGIDWAFSPVVDIDMNFRNPITNTRTFGSDPDQVERLSVRFIERLQAHGIAAAAKHFPGDGVDERDQHLVTSSNDLPCEAWDETYGQVFRGCIAAGTKSIMVGHIRQPAWSRRLRPGIEDADLLPASLAPELIEGLLRGHLGFNGLVVSDASVMAGMAVMPRRELVPATIGPAAT